MKVRFTAEGADFVRSREAVASANPENGFHQSIWRITRGVFKVLEEPHVARREDHRLHRSLVGFWRVKISSEYRAIYVIHDGREEVLVLLVGERAPTDPARDVYHNLLARLRSGDFDAPLADFGTPWVEPPAE